MTFEGHLKVLCDADIKSVNTVKEERITSDETTVNVVGVGRAERLGGKSRLCGGGPVNRSAQNGRINQRRSALNEAVQVQVNPRTVDDCKRCAGNESGYHRQLPPGQRLPDKIFSA